MKITAILNIMQVTQVWLSQRERWEIVWVHDHNGEVLLLNI